jgi:hypothetical protein
MILQGKKTTRVAFLPFEERTTWTPFSSLWAAFALVSRETSAAMVRGCLDNGYHEIAVWCGVPAMDIWKRLKNSALPLACNSQINSDGAVGCDLSETLHQLTCPLPLEVTDQCGLQYPLCFRGSGSSRHGGPTFWATAFWRSRVVTTADSCYVELLGREPMLLPGVRPVVEMGRMTGFFFRKGEYERPARCL